MIQKKHIPIDNYQLFVKEIILEESSREAPIIFLHDSWGCTEMWGDFPEKLSKLSDSNSIIYDRQGYGKSSPFSIKQRTKHYLHNEAHLLVRLMDALNVPKAILYGHSDGASISLIAAALYPDRFEAILLEGVHSFVEEKGQITIKESREKSRHNLLIQTLEQYHGNKAKELFRLWHETWLADFFKDWNIFSILREIRCPVLAFRGENDPFDTIEQLNVLEREICSKVVTSVIPDAAHTPRKENEEETMRLINTFFKILHS
ncbi:MAG: alpha/beta fold hydrolase [Paludibacteraceae bacterium]